MENKEVYDYLAKIYLDKKDNSKKQNRRQNKPWKHTLFLIAIVAVTLLTYIILRRVSSAIIKPRKLNMYIANTNELIKIDYNFANSSLKKSGYSMELPALNIEDFQYLAFRARRMKNNKTSLHLKVEIENGYKEKSYVYIKDIGSKWSQYSIKLNDFKEITRRNSLKRISFMVEEWNAEDKSDIIFIDEVRFTQERG